MKNNEFHKNVLAVTLFPETFADALDILCRRMPFLRMPCMRCLLVQKASFFTMFAVSLPSEADYDLKVDEGVNVSMYIMIEGISNSLFTDEWEDAVRKYSNYNFLDTMIADYVKGLVSPQKKLRYPK
ncbi:MAG: hypothetical protein WAV98_01075 [Minisyncoccia bacterium]